MEEYKTAAKIEQEGELRLSDLPFQGGDEIEVILLRRGPAQTIENPYPLGVVGPWRQTVSASLRWTSSNSTRRAARPVSRPDREEARGVCRGSVPRCYAGTELATGPLEAATLEAPPL